MVIQLVQNLCPIFTETPLVLPGKNLVRSTLFVFFLSSERQCFPWFAIKPQLGVAIVEVLLLPKHSLGMSKHAYVYTYIYIRVYIYIYTHVTRLHMFIYVCIYVQMYMHTCLRNNETKRSFRNRLKVSRMYFQENCISSCVSRSFWVISSYLLRACLERGHPKRRTSRFHYHNCSSEFLLVNP